MVQVEQGGFTEFDTVFPALRGTESQMAGLFAGYLVSCNHESDGRTKPLTHCPIF